MNVEESLRQVTGAWQGTNLLRMMPTDEYTESESRATISLLAQGNAATIAYTWSGDGKPQDGLMLVINGAESGSAVAVWVDSWHQSPQWMELSGGIDDRGVIRLRGSYAANAGWRITVDPTDADRFRLAMDNIMPDADYQVVEAIYSRAG